MQYAIQVNASPGDSRTPLTAWQFIKAARAAGHGVIRVFFYRDGIDNAFAADGAPDWPALARDEGIELVYCVTAAERRDRAGRTPRAGFQAGGLGLWADACLRADRVLVFQ